MHDSRLYMGYIYIYVAERTPDMYIWGIAYIYIDIDLRM